jgi:5,10-methylenetetrahydromethanopterin reductase
MRTGLWLFPDAPSPAMVDAIAAAERGGVGEIWIGDEGPARDPFALLAAAAVRTSSIRLGVGVTNPYLRHPAVTASTMATINELAGGRAVLGIGPGGHLSLGPVGLTADKPLTACRDAVRIMRAVLRGEAVDGYIPPSHAMTAPDVPIYVGARGERFNRWASQEADGVFLAGIAPSMLDEVVGWARSSRPIDVALYVSCLSDPGEVETIRPRMIHAFSNGPDALLARAGLTRADAQDAADALADGDDEPARRVLDDNRLGLVLARSPEQGTDWLADLVRRHRPASAGLALIATDPVSSVERVAAVLSRFADEQTGADR